MNTQAVHVGIYDTLADWEVGAAIAHINKDDWQKSPGRYRVVTVGSTTEPIVTMGGMRIVPDTTLDRVDPAGSVSRMSRGQRQSLDELTVCRSGLLGE